MPASMRLRTASGGGIPTIPVPRLRPFQGVSFEFCAQIEGAPAPGNSAPKALPAQHEKRHRQRQQALFHPFARSFFVFPPRASPAVASPGDSQAQARSLQKRTRPAGGHRQFIHASNSRALPAEIIAPGPKAQQLFRQIRVAPRETTCRSRSAPAISAPPQSSETPRYRTKGQMQRIPAPKK